MRRLFFSMMLAVGAALGADVSGTWNATIKIQGNTGTPTFVLKQEGENLTGTYTGRLGKAPLTGTVKGDQVEFQFEAKSSQMSGTIKYKGILTGSTMTGTASFGNMGEGTWKATKK